MELVTNKTDKDYKKILELINNINMKFQDYELIVSVKPDVKTLLTSEFINDDFDSMTNFVNWLESIYVKSSDLKTKITELLTTIYTTSDYESMTGLNTYLLSLLNGSIKLPIFIMKFMELII